MVCMGQLDGLNRAWALLIAAFPRTHILSSLVFIALFGVWLRGVRIELDIRASFSPADSKAAYENRVYREFYNLTASPQRSFVLLSAKDGGNVLRPHCVKEVLQLDAAFSGFLQEVDPTTGFRGCHPLCNLNRPFHMVSDHILSIHNGSKPSELLLDFPCLIYNNVNIFVGMNLAEVTLSDKIFPQNNSKIVSAKTIILWYFARVDTPLAKKRLSEKTSEFFQLGQEGAFLDNVKFEIFGDEIANKEMVRGAIEATVLMSIGFLLLLIFVTYTVYTKIGRMSKLAVPVVVFTAVLCPFLGCVAAFGLCALLGFPVYTIMCVCPFLVQGVGVDDAFIMLQSWSHHGRVRVLRDRLALVFIHIGPSITITSLTNTIAFGIGFFTPTPQMSLFCLCTSFALLFDYVLTFTLLAPIIYICTPSEDGASVKEANFAALLSSSEKHQNEVSATADPLAEISARTLAYSRFLSSKKGRVTALLVFIAMQVMAYSGVVTMKSSFEPSKAFPSDSPLAKSIGVVRSVFDEFFPVNVIVNNPPDVTDNQELTAFYDMVNELETLPPSYGPDRTLLWLRAFEQYDLGAAQLFSFLGYNASQHELSYTNLGAFLEHLDNPPTVKVARKNGSLDVTAFQFSFLTKGQAEWAERAVTEEKTREILLRYPEFNASIYDGDSAVLDLLLTVKMDLIGSMAVTVVCMTLICSIFIHNQVGVALVAATITSVCFMLVGFISWWGADLDPVTMVDVLLATGFSVDYTAHIVHQFYAKTHPSGFVRIAQSIHEMSGPMIQAGFSTALCMLPLIFVPTYAIVAFAKTVFVVVGVGLVHGLFFMPVVICLIPHRFGNCLNGSSSTESAVEKSVDDSTESSLLHA